MHIAQCTRLDALVRGGRGGERERKLRRAAPRGRSVGAPCMVEPDGDRKPQGEGRRLLRESPIRICLGDGLEAWTVARGKSSVQQGGGGFDCTSPTMLMQRAVTAPDPCERRERASVKQS